MKFSLTIEVSEDVGSRTEVIVEVSNELSHYFSERDYGPDVAAIYVGIICVSPEFDFFSKVRKPKYTAYREYILEGIPVVEDRVFTYDIKLDYAAFRNQSDTENERMLANAIVHSLANLNSIPKKVKEFDRDKFRNDIRDFLTSRYLSTG